MNLEEVREDKSVTADGRVYWPSVLYYEFQDEDGDWTWSYNPPAKDNVTYYMRVLDREGLEHLIQTGALYTTAHRGRPQKIVDRRVATG